MMTSKLPIVGYGSPILNQICGSVDDTEQTQDIISGLLLTMNDIKTSVGLAAPQVNYAKRVFVMRPNGVDIVCINPIIKKRETPVLFDERCLSIPGVDGKGITRDNKIEVEFFDQYFNRKKMRLKGFEAIVFQHEYDHLNGILFTDRLSKDGLDEIREKLYNIESAKPVYDIVYFK